MTVQTFSLLNQNYGLSVHGGLFLSELLIFNDLAVFNKKYF
jgi:hypothetical protein